jgi:hypothetical protein
LALDASRGPAARALRQARPAGADAAATIVLVGRSHFEEMMMTADFGRTDARSHAEGPVAKSIEEQTAKLPSDTFLWLAVGAITGSAVLQIAGNKHVSLFVGQWAPTFLLLGLYNKLVKQLGSDRTENAV